MTEVAKQTRPGWDLWFMRIAYVTAERGSCLRKRVGALVVRDSDKRIIAGGYNGAPRGLPDCLTAGCDLRVIDGRESCVRTLHAESNALDLCGRIHDEPHTLYTTVIPCRNCALRIIQHGIARVVYHEYYESQGTKEVEGLFEQYEFVNVEKMIRESTIAEGVTDPDEQQQRFEDISARWERARAAGLTPRVLSRLDVPMEEVRASYGAKVTDLFKVPK